MTTVNFKESKNIFLEKNFIIYLYKSLERRSFGTQPHNRTQKCSNCGFTSAIHRVVRLVVVLFSLLFFPILLLWKKI